MKYFGEIFYTVSSMTLLLTEYSREGVKLISTRSSVIFGPSRDIYNFQHRISKCLFYVVILNGLSSNGPNFIKELLQYFNHIQIRYYKASENLELKLFDRLNVQIREIIYIFLFGLCSPGIFLKKRIYIF